MAKKKKENRRKRLRSLILLLFLTILLLSTSTYAWFTANRSVTIDPINVQIAASSGLQISTDASNWKTIITNGDINTPTGYTGNKNMLPNDLEPVSTAGITISGGYLDFYKGEVAGATFTGGVTGLGLTATQTPAEAKYVYNSSNPGTQPFFVAFDIFLKVSAEEGQTTVPIYLERGSGVLTQTGKTSKGLEYAARYAFVIEGNGAVTDEVSTLQAKTATVGSNAIVVEPNYDAHNSSGVIHASQNYSITTTAAAKDVAAVSYLGVKAAISNPIILVDTNPGGAPSSSYFQSISNLIKTNVAYSKTDDDEYSYDGKTSSDPNLVRIFSLTPGITKIRVYMWVEGQDIDCEDTASGAFLTYKIGFTLDDED